MTLEQLHKHIEAGRYADSAIICEEDGTQGKRIYIVYDNIPPPSPARFFVDTVAGYKVRFGL